jgi:ribosomal protein S18 acetylase RimI-like enzyme
VTTLREAYAKDIPDIMHIRAAVRENKLSDPSKITKELVHEYLFNRGKGWVVEVDGHVAGFCIIDPGDAHVWALFVHPEFEGKGHGRQLFEKMITWYFDHFENDLRISTDPGTRAARFYTGMGCKKVGFSANGEIIFMITKESFNLKKSEKRSEG